jgi:protein ImuA
MALVRSNLGRSFREARDPHAPSLRKAFSIVRDETPVAARKTAQRLVALRQAVEKLERPIAAPAQNIPFGLIEIDRYLPGAGLARGALHEMLAAAHGDKPAAFGFAVAIAVRALDARRGPAVLVVARRTLRDFGAPYGHGLSALGLDPGRLMLIETRNDKDALWAIEETLKSKAAAMVLGAVADIPDLTMSRRMSLAASASATPILLLSPSTGKEPSAAMTRWSIGAASAIEKREPGVRARWRVALERCRNGRTGQWIVEWDHVAHCFSLARGLADDAPHAGRGEESLDLARRRAG